MSMEFASWSNDNEKSFSRDLTEPQTLQTYTATNQNIFGMICRYQMNKIICKIVKIVDLEQNYHAYLVETNYLRLKILMLNLQIMSCKQGTWVLPTHSE